MDLGAPIGQRNTVPSGGFDQGEHGAGTGLSGGYDSQPNAQNSQAAMMADQEKTGFNAGLGGEHASAGLPKHTSSSTPIADQFMGTGGASKLDNALDQYSGSGQSQSQSGQYGSSGLGGGYSSGAPAGDAVSGQYAGGGTGDALTGESHAQRTGAGVGPLGENLGSGGASYGSTGANYGSSGTGIGADDRSAALGADSYGTGVGAAGGAGGHYSSTTSGSGSTGYDQTNQGNTGLGATGAGVGAGAGAAGAAGAIGLTGQSGDQYHSADKDRATDGAGGAGHYGRANEGDFDRGAPVSDPKHLDSGGRHGLVFQESTGKYVHRHELEENR